jgi:hypothetical protein
MIVTNAFLYLQILLYQSTMFISLGFNNPIRCTIFIVLLYNCVPACGEQYMHIKNRSVTPLQWRKCKKKSHNHIGRIALLFQCYATTKTSIKGWLVHYNCIFNIITTKTHDSNSGILPRTKLIITNLKKEREGLAVKYISSTSNFKKARVKDKPTQLFLLLTVAAAHTLVSIVMNLLWTTAAHDKIKTLLPQNKRKLRIMLNQNITLTTSKDKLDIIENNYIHL